MNDFHYLDQQLWCEKVAVSVIAEQVGTPFYLYSYQTLKIIFASSIRLLQRFHTGSVLPPSPMLMLRFSGFLFWKAVGWILYPGVSFIAP